jgi:hypothetical protein
VENNKMKSFFPEILRDFVPSCETSSSLVISEWITEILAKSPESSQRPSMTQQNYNTERINP